MAAQSVPPATALVYHRVMKIVRMIGRVLPRAMKNLCIVASLLAVMAPGAEAQQGRASRLAIFSTAELSIETSFGRHEFTVEIARTGRQQAQGLMFRRRLAADAGMLFVYRRAAPISMWMRNTFIPLDMLFIGADGRIAHIAPRATPHSLETISSGGPVKSVLELNAGTIARLNIKIGDRVYSPALDR